MPGSNLSANVKDPFCGRLLPTGNPDMCCLHGGEQVERNQSAQVLPLSLLEVGGIRLLLHVNHAAVRRLLARSRSFGDFPGS